METPDDSNDKKKYTAPVVGDDGLVKTLHHPEGIDPTDLFFNEEKVSGLVLEWKRTHDHKVWQDIVTETLPLIDTMILYGRYTEYDQIDALRSECVIKLYKLLERFDPNRGRAFTIFSISIKNFLLTYSQKVDNKAKSVFNADDEFLDTIEGAVYINENYSSEFKRRIMDLDTRFHEKNYLDSMRYLVNHFLKEGFTTSKSKLCASISMAYDLTPDTSYFLYDYTLIKMRSTLLDMNEVSFLDVDLLKISKRWSFIPELVELVGLKNVSKMVEVFAGVNFTFPTKRDVDKLRYDRNVMARIKAKGCSCLDIRDISEELGGDPQASLDKVLDGKIKGYDREDYVFDTERKLEIARKESSEGDSNEFDIYQDDN